jgi:flagellar basal body-associated protein FliL
MSEAKEAPAAPAAAPGGGGIKAMLPLILNVVLMPAIAFAMTQFVLVPKLSAPATPAAGHAEAGEGHEAAADPHAAPDDAHGKKDDGHGAAKDDGHGKKDDGGHGGGGGGPAKAGPVPLSGKILVNVAGSAGTRFLQANISLVSPKSNLKDLVEKFDAQLRDAASSALSTKTISDLEKTGARNLIKAELLGQFNIILGSGTVTDVYLTEFAIQ